MVSRLQSMVVKKQQLRKLSSFTPSRSLRKSPVAMDAVLGHIHELKLKLEAMVREYSILLQNLQLPTEVKVEKRNGKGLVIKVVSGKKERGMLVAILESLEEMGVNVVEAKVSCTHGFYMEAVGEAEDEDEDFRKLTQQILKAIGEPGVLLSHSS